MFGPNWLIYSSANCCSPKLRCNHDRPSIAACSFSRHRDCQSAGSGISGLDARLINQYRQRGWVLLENVVERTDLDAAAARLSTLSSMGRSDRYSNSGRVDFTKIPNLSKNDEAFRRLASSPRFGRRGGSAPRATRADISRRSHRQARARGRSFYLPSGFRILGRQAKCIVVRVDPISRRRDRRRLPMRDQSSHLKHYPHDLLFGEGVRCRDG